MKVKELFDAMPGYSHVEIWNQYEVTIEDGRVFDLRKYDSANVVSVEPALRFTGNRLPACWIAVTVDFE